MRQRRKLRVRTALSRALQRLLQARASQKRRRLSLSFVWTLNKEHASNKAYAIGGRDSSAGGAAGQVQEAATAQDLLCDPHAQPNSAGCARAEALWLSSQDGHPGPASHTKTAQRS